MNVLSYGGGRQTAGMLALIKLGELPKPDLVIFADTGAELPETYQHIERVAKPLCDSLDIAFETVRQSGHYGDNLFDYAWRYRWIPQPWGRVCSEKFKRRPINKYIRAHGGSATLLIGISDEEAHRRRTPKENYLMHEYPLVDRHLSVRDCVAAMRLLNFPEPIKSACYFCPFQRWSRWQFTKRHHPELIDKAIALEEHSWKLGKPKWYITGKTSLRRYLEGEQAAWEELLQAEAGCHSGMCFV